MNLRFVEYSCLPILVFQLKPNMSNQGLSGRCRDSICKQSAVLLKMALDSLDIAVVVMFEAGNETLFLNVTNLLA